MANKPLLKDIVIIRIIAVILLVLFHSLAPYNHGWKPFNGFVEIRAYDIFAYFIYVVFMALFVFISGFVFSYQIHGRGKQFTLRILIVGKAMRLLLPALLFGIIYLFIFSSPIQFNLKTLVSLFSGVGHLWFLPMLFWCFIFGWMVDRIRVKEGVKIGALFLLTFLAVLPDYFGLSNATRWLVVFYFGMWVYKNKEFVLSRINNLLSLGILLFFVLTFVLCDFLWPVLEEMGQSSMLWLATFYFAKRAGVFLMSSSVCLSVYCFLNNHLIKVAPPTHTLNKNTRNLQI